MKFVPNAVSVRVARKVLLGRKHSPQLLFGAGIVGFGTTVVLACKATLQVEGVLDAAEERLERTHSLEAQGVEVEISKGHIYGAAALDLAKLYAPAIACGALSIAALVGSHHILSKRNAALLALSGSLQKTLDEYRDRVRAKYGDEAERDIYNDAQVCEIEDENGKVKKVKKATVGGSPYAKLFDESNVNWNPTPEYNYLFLKAQQAYWNDRLQTKGHVFLNEIYDDLGFERTKIGAIAGWVKGGADNYIDFGIFDDNNDRIIDFMVGREKSVWLDFNVDGSIYNLI